MFCVQITQLEPVANVHIWYIYNNNSNNNNNLTACSEGSKPGERLFARALHTNEQSMGAINAEDSVHSGKMFQGVIK